MSEAAKISARMLECPACRERGEPLVILAGGDAALYCCHGLAWKSMPGGGTPTLNADQIALELASMAADSFARFRAEQASNLALAQRLAEFDKGGEVSAKEIRRRARILAERAETAKGGLGEAICPVCGKKSRRYALVSHLRRCHLAELQGMRASVFC